MTERIAQIVYFAQLGPANTERTLELARDRAKALEIDTVLVATTSGTTAVRATEIFAGVTVVAVTHSTGYP